MSEEIITLDTIRSKQGVDTVSLNNGRVFVMLKVGYSFRDPERSAVHHRMFPDLGVANVSTDLHNLSYCDCISCASKKIL